MKKNEQKMKLDHVSVDMFIGGTVLRIDCDLEWKKRRGVINNLINPLL